MIWTGELVNSGDPSHVTQTYPTRNLWGRERVLEAKGSTSWWGFQAFYNGSDEGPGSFIGPVRFFFLFLTLFSLGHLPGYGD